MLSSMEPKPELFSLCCTSGLSYHISILLNVVPHFQGNREIKITPDLVSEMKADLDKASKEFIRIGDFPSLQERCRNTIGESAAHSVYRPVLSKTETIVPGLNLPLW